MLYTPQVNLFIIVGSPVQYIIGVHVPHIMCTPWWTCVYIVHSAHTHMAMWRYDFHDITTTCSNLYTTMQCETCMHIYYTHAIQYTHNTLRQGHLPSCARTLFRDSSSTIPTQLLYIRVREDQSLTNGCSFWEG